MSTRKLQQVFTQWSQAAMPLVLATVCETSGSTYSKCGAQMLLTGDGRFQGMLSGGCLEGDLAERAAAVIASGRPDSATYDLRQNDEELWGLGVGCEGVMRIFLQPLDPQSGYEPLASMTDIFSGYRHGHAITIIDSAHSGLVPGGTIVVQEDTVLFSSVAPAMHESFTDLPGQSATATANIGGHEVTYLYARLEPPPRVLVLGAGLDAEPVVRLCNELGWRTSVVDHRPAYIAKGDFSGAERVFSCPAADLSRAIDLQEFAATIVMSHHLDSDRSYLRQLADSEIGYVGLLGPRERRRRLMAEIGPAAAALAGRLHGPAGLDLGGRGPAPIALSIVAEMHRHLVGGRA